MFNSLARPRRARSGFRASSILMLIPVMLLAACATPMLAPTVPAPTSPPTQGTLTEVSLVTGFVPNVQYAPLFVADRKGYFAREGLKVNYNWGFEYDGVKLVGAQQADFAIIGGDQVLQARAQGIPLIYVANWYNAFPIVVFSLAEKNIKTPQDLIGKKVGLPGFFGASYTAWRALLYTQKIDDTKLDAQNIGFTQAQAVTQGAVDAAVGYANNEPVQLALAGKTVNVIRTWEYARLIGNGVAVSERTLAERPALVKGFVRALLQGVQDSLANPEEALKIATGAYPEFASDKSATAVLNASIELWKSQRPGYTDPADWKAMANFMRAANLIEKDVETTKAFTNQFIP